MGLLIFRKLHVLLFAVLYCLVFAEKIECRTQEKDHSMETITEFINREGISQHVNMQKVGIVAAPWDSIVDELIKDKTVNKITYSNVFTQSQHIITKNIDLQIGTTSVTLEINVASNYHEAIKEMLTSVTQTTMQKIPFVKSTPQVGNLSLSSPIKNYFFYWVYLNTFFKLDCSGGNIDLFSLASKIQNLLIPYTQQELLIPPLVIEPAENDITINKGKSVLIQIKPDCIPEHFFITTKNENIYAITSRIVNNRQVQIVGDEVGCATLYVVYADPKTLLSNYLKIDVTVVE
jgi:hypothetical protein